MYRDCFVSLYHIINCDYSSQEARVLADISGDANMIRFFNEGDEVFKDDFHSWVATKMFRVIYNNPELVCLKSTHPEERQTAKNLGFKLAYGGTAFTVKDDLNVEEDVAVEFIDGYFAAFPSLQEDFRKAEEKALNAGYITIDSVTNRKWIDREYKKMKALKQWLKDIYPKDFKTWDEKKQEEFKKKHGISKKWSEYFSWEGKLKRAALNYRIQGLSGSMTKYAAIYFRKYQLENDGLNKYYPINLVHDEILVEVLEEKELEVISAVIKKCMEEAGNTMCKKVKMSAVPVISKVWEH